MRLCIAVLVVLVALANGKPSRQTQQTSDRDSGSSSSRTGTGRTDRDRDRDRTNDEFESKSVSVRGYLLCGNVPATNVRVKLWASETDLEPINLLDSKRTDHSGYFMMEGSDHNKPNIAVFQQPVLTIYHNCDYDNKDKVRRVLIKIPSTYVGMRRFLTKIYDIGKLNLEVEFPKETHEKVEKVDALSVRRLLMKMLFF